MDISRDVPHAPAETSNPGQIPTRIHSITEVVDRNIREVYLAQLIFAARDLARQRGAWFQEKENKVGAMSPCIYNSYMDVFTTLDGQQFVWDSDKASSNASTHGVRFEQAQEAFFDPLARYEDASPEQEARQACIGETSEYVCSMSSMWFGKVMCSASSPRDLRDRRKGDVMKMSERIKRNMQPDKPMTLISLRLPEHVIDDLKEVAPVFGFGGYQALIRSYISHGLRKHLAEVEAQRAKDSAVEEFSRRLKAHGVPEHAIQEAAAEMKGSR